MQHTLVTAMKRIKDMILDRRGSEFTEIATGLVLIVLAGVLAFSGLGQKIAATISQVTSGM